MPVTPDELNEWKWIICSWASYILGGFGFVFGIVWITDPARLTIALGASVSLLGGPSVFRIFSDDKKSNSHEKRGE